MSDTGGGGGGRSVREPDFAPERDPGDAVPPGVAPVEPVPLTDEDRRVLAKLERIGTKGEVPLNSGPAVTPEREAAADDPGGAEDAPDEGD